MAAKVLRFRVYPDRAKGWRWSLIGLNGKKMADSGESYKTRAGVIKAVETIQALAPFSLIEVEDVAPAKRKTAARRKAK